MKKENCGRKSATSMARNALAALVVFAAGSLFANYEYIYWQITPQSNISFSYASVAYGSSTDSAVGYLTIGDTDMSAVLGNASGGTDATYAKLVASPTTYSYWVELYNETETLVGRSESMVSYTELTQAGAVYGGIAPTGATAYGFSGFTAVPEPTSGLLLLFGLAGLALRRKGGLKPATARTRTVISAAAIMAAGSLFAAQNDTLISFSTRGPDKYMDGSQVLDGECYALVWTADGAAFGGFAADGSLVKATDKLVLAAGIAKDGHCPTTLFEIDADAAEGYKGGSFAVYLVDTRVKGAAGEVAVGMQKGGTKIPAVNAAGFATAGGVANLGEVGVYAKIESPVITALKVDGAKVELKVAGMVPTAEYFVVAGESPNKFAQPKAAKAEGDTFSFEAQPGESCFKVIGARKFE